MNERKEEPNKRALKTAAEILMQGCHGAAFNAGWWTDLETGEIKRRPLPELLMLIVTEVAEAMEGYRKDLMDDHLKHRKMVEVELADAVIRIFDTAGGYGMDLPGAIMEKHQYNKQRLDHKIEERMKEGGKKL